MSKSAALKSLNAIQVVLTTAVVLLLPSWANLSSAADLRRNDVELAFMLSASDDDKQSGQELSLETQLGLMLTNTHEIGLAIDWTYRDPDAGSTFSGGHAGVFYTYNFATLSRTTIPFTGLQVYLPVGDDEDTQDYGFKGYLGMRFLPTHYTSF
ncbi:MAG: hypothetical protein HKM24_08140, partial [Gammaproteobacteria bacterium]|nr:hypothetical protein [Gammaproteobacteria bacterium]